MSEPLQVFNAFPEIVRLGKHRVQELCDEFRETHVAREFAITRLDVDSDLLLSFACELTHDFTPGEEYHFPMDELLRFIAERGIEDDGERETLRGRILTARQQGGPDLYRRFMLNPGPKLPLFLTCKNPECQNSMQTQLTAYHCERLEFDYIEPITCPRCKQTSTFADGDLHFGPNDGG